MMENSDVVYCTYNLAIFCNISCPDHQGTTGWRQVAGGYTLSGGKGCVCVCMPKDDR